MLLAFFLVIISSLTCFTLLIAIGYRERVRRVTISANYNAALWAQSEAKLYEAVVELAKQETLAQAETKRANELSVLAYQALAVARGKVFEPCQFEGFHDDPNCPLTEWPDEIG